MGGTIGVLVMADRVGTPDEMIYGWRPGEWQMMMTRVVVVFYNHGQQQP